MLSDARGLWDGGGAHVLGVQSLYFYWRKLDFAMNRHYVESNIHILLTRNFSY